MTNLQLHPLFRSQTFPWMS